MPDDVIFCLIQKYLDSKFVVPADRDLYQVITAISQNCVFQDYD